MVKFIPSPRIPGVLFFLFLIFPFTTEGQVSSNISVMDSLIAESVAAYENQNSDGEPVHLAINLPGEYSYFEAKILKAFKNKYGAINYGGKREGNFILYSLESVSVEYLPNEENSLTAAHCKVPRSLLTTSVLSASPSTSSAIKI